MTVRSRVLPGYAFVPLLVLSLGSPSAALADGPVAPAVAPAVAPVVAPMISACGTAPGASPCVTRWTCLDGVWEPTYRAAGYACNDSVACTYNDRCDGAGTCAGTSITCTGGQCTTSTCNGTSTCTVASKANGTTCTDGNACTQTDTCQAGVCTGANPVVCTANQCHTVGTCNTSTGVCSTPTKPNGTTCSDGNACTRTDTCQAGACTGSNPVVCTASDQCHSAGTCSSSTGLCSNPAKANGATCTDGNACTQTDTCQAGVCSGANPIVCTASDQCHTAGTCSTSTGVCSNPAKANGMSCSDGNLCTYGEVCTNGVCGGGTAKTCDPNARCGPEACNGTASCTVAPIPIDDGDSCTTDNACNPTTGVTHSIIAGCSQAAGAPPIVAPYPDASPPGGMPMAPGLGVDESSGTLGYTYRFDLPKARGRFQPGVALSYKHTGTRDFGTGIGWTLEGPMKRSWELDPATGTYTREWVDLGGTRVLMVAGPGGLKRNESGSFVLVGTANGNGYVDAAGNTYDFGSPTGVQVQTVTDVFGNETRYEYVVGYPDMLAAISYDKFVGAFGADYATRVDLVYDTLPQGVTLDVDVSTGAALRRTQKLGSVVVKNHAGGSLGNWAAVAQYKLEYATRGHRQLLTKVTHMAGQPVGGTGVFTAEPPTMFEYDPEVAYALGAGTEFNVQALAGSAEVEWVDLDGDGRPDLVWSSTTTSPLASTTTQYWARNLTDLKVTVPSSPGLKFAPVQVLPGNWWSTQRAWMDFNGDGIADRLDVGTPGCLPGVLMVRFGQRSIDLGGTVSVSYGTGTCLQMTQGVPNLYDGLTRSDSDGRIIGKLVDVNGDGVLDWLQPWREAGSPTSTGGWEVLHGHVSNSGWAFGPPVRYSLTDYDLADGAPPLSGGRGIPNPPDYAPGPSPAQFMPTDLFATMDMNGDGVPDFVQAVAASTGADTSTRWRVRYLTRNGLQVETMNGRAFTSSATGFPLTTERYIEDYLDYSVEPLDCVPNTRSACLPPGALLVPGIDDSRLTGMPLDLDGDGLPDFLTRTAAGQLQVWWNQGDRFDPGALLALPAGAGGTEDVYPSLSHGEDPKKCGRCNNILYEPQVPNGEPFYIPTYYPRKVNSNLTGQFIDLDGDGILDYVRTADPAVRATTSPSGVFFRGIRGSTLLRAVTIPKGAKFTVGYTPTVNFDGSYAKAARVVVSDILVEGPELVAQVVAWLPGSPGMSWHNRTHYWYSTPVAGSSWTSNGGVSSRGFAQTWVADDVTRVVRATTWETGSHVTAGSAKSVTWAVADTWAAADPYTFGAGPPPTSARFREHTTTFSVKSLGSSSCLDATDLANGASGAPYIAVATSAAQVRYVNGVGMGSTASQSCGDVDDYGNPTRITVTPAGGGGSYQVLASYDSTAACKSCPVETWTSPDGTKASALRHSKYFYADGANGPYGLGTVGVGRLKFVSRKANASTWEVQSSTNYFSNGNPQVAQTGDFLESAGSVTGTHWMNRTFTYDSFGLRVTREDASDSANPVTLTTETVYESLSGLPRKVTGPYVSGSSAPKIVKTMAYDGLGRPVAVGRGISASGTTPTTITEAVSAMVYAPPTEFPQWARTYAFAAPMTLACPQGGECLGTSSEQPADVKVSLAYMDGLGRTIQVRERMGGSGTAAGNPANVTQALSASAYRVSGSVLIDGAGRTVGALEPFHSSGSVLESFATIAVGSRRGSYTTRDVQGRVSCALSGVYTAAVANAAACTQSDTDDANYRTSVRFTYGSGDMIVGVQTMAVTATAGNAVRGTVTSYDAGARALRIVDPMLSKSVVTYDLLGQARTSTRQGPGGEMPQTVTTTYDLVGRVTEIADPNWLASGQPASAMTDAYGRGRRTIEYFSHGGVKKLTLPAMEIGGGAALRPYVTTTYGSLLRKTSVATYEPKYVAGLGWTFTSRTSTFIYDKPRGADATTYPYVAGRLAEASNEVSAIAFGYDQDGTPKERDQWFTPLGSTRYGASIATGNDGRAVQAQFTSLGSPTISYSLQYDSFGRPVKVVAANTGTTALWATTTTAVDGAGAYDALGRVADSRGYVASNGGTVTTKRTYGAYSGQMLGQETKLGTTDLYRVGSMGYLGEKLTQMTDTGTATTYGWAYDTGGRLVTATATANTSSGLTQNYSHSFAFSPVWNLTTANVSWNGTATTSQGYTYSGTDQATQAPGGYQPAYALTHDGMGNIIDRRVPLSPTAAETITYTAEGYLRSIVRGGSTDEMLFYDALGNLAYRRSGTNLWFYAGEHATITATAVCTTDPCAPTPGTVKVNVHVLLAGARIATVRTTPGQTTDQAFENVLYFHRDRQGSVVATTTTGGFQGVQYRYGPYGELDRYSGSEATAGSDLGYTGGLRLTGGLIHLRARVYDPSYRRFLQADIVDSLRYTYTNGDPTNYVDPSGRATTKTTKYASYTVIYYYDDNGKLVKTDVVFNDSQGGILQRILAYAVKQKAGLGESQPARATDQGAQSTTPPTPTQATPGSEPRQQTTQSNDGELKANANTEMRLPNDPAGLGPEWSRDPRHLNPNGDKFHHPDGSDLEFHKGVPGMPGNRGEDHWHHNGGDEHLPPGAEIPDPANRLLVGVAVAGGGAYAVYRVLRLIPSLAPPLWWTLPANVVAP